MVVKVKITPPIFSSRGGSAMTERNKLSKQIVEAVSRMPAKVRQVFLLSHDRGLSIQEIAETLFNTRNR
jgi:DNA-directed RNA polymerase specialized sigma24 family protein